MIFHLSAVIFTGLLEKTLGFTAHYPFVTIVSVACTMNILHYFLNVIHKPEILVEQGSSFHRFLKERCPAAIETYKPPIWCYGSRVQTILRPIIQQLLRPDILYRRELLNLDDGGVIALDWFDKHAGDDTDIIVMLPGLTGCSQAEYIKYFCTDAFKTYKRIVTVNYRGLGGVPLKTPKSYCFTKGDDLSFALKHIQDKNPDCQIMGVGVSMGGVLLTHYLVSTKQNILCGGMAISSPWHPNISSDSLEKPVNWIIFNRFLTTFLKDMVESSKHVFEPTGIVDVKRIRRCSSIREFDEHLTTKLFGYDGTKEYYEKATLADKIAEIKIPMLYLNAADDVFCPGESIGEQELFTSQNVACVKTKYGGHIAFLDGVLVPTGETLMSRLLLQFSNAIFKHRSEIEFDEKQDSSNKTEIESDEKQDPETDEGLTLIKEMTECHAVFDL